ncbi:MAG TPA: methyltransferase domain-containing protein [Candidatus Polarisedimenticolia bacterium]|nr:methyltransferase domain-containing protein [Candidatus Polarisedimenticolia bacterium]
MRSVIALGLGVLLLVGLVFVLLACARGEAGAPGQPARRAEVPAAAPTDAAAGHHAHGAAAGPDAAADHATVHHAFNDPERWAKVFDDPARDAWQKPVEVVASLGLRKGMTVADLGAGTGYFTAALARAVGPTGVVLSIDPEPEMVEYLGRRAHREGLANVVPVLALYEDPFLPPGRVDRVLIVDTYHHIDDRQQYFRRVGDDLAPGGRVAVVDFHKRPLPVGPPPEAKLDREVVVAEMQKAGYRLAEEPTFLPYQYYLVFEPIRGAPQ